MTLIAPFDVSGAPPKRLNWVRSALASLDPDVHPRSLLPRDIPLIFGAVKNVPGTNKPAAGYTLAGPKTLVRHGMENADNLTRETTEYVVLHEGFGHARMKLVPISRKNWKALKTLLKGSDSGTYWGSKLEAIIDAAIEAISGVESPYKHDPAHPEAKNRYTHWVDDADLPEVKWLWLADTAQPTTDPEPQPEPEPLPDPVDPCAELRAEIDRLKAENAQLDMELTSSQITIINARTFRDKAIEDLKLVAP